MEEADDAPPDEPATSDPPPAPGRHIHPACVSTQPRAERAGRVADTLREQISAGVLKGTLPGNHALAQTLDASRNSVREALGLLRDEGLVTRRRGVGTVVVTPSYGHGLDRLEGLAEALAGHGTVTNRVLLAEEAVDPPVDVLHRLALAADETVVNIERVRSIDGTPVSLDSTYLTADVG